MNELQACDIFLATRLRADATLAALVGTKVYAALASQGEALPYVLFSFAGGTDRETIPRSATSRAFARPRYLVKAVTDAGTRGVDFSAADEIAAAVDAALMGSVDTVTVGGITYRVDCAGREEPVRYLETPDGKRYAHVGGFYRFFIQRIG